MIYKLGLLAIFVILPLAFAYAQPVVYEPIVGIPGVQDATDFDSYIDALYALSISLAALIAVVKIVIAGAKYMLSDLISSKADAKNDIWNSLIGLLIIIAAVVILNTINSDLTNLQLFDEGDIITINDAGPTVMAQHCAELEAEGGMCATANCFGPISGAPSEIWGRYQPIYNAGCYNLTCEDACGYLGGTYSDGYTWDSCEDIDPIVLEGELKREVLDPLAQSDLCTASEGCIAYACSDSSAMLNFEQGLNRSEGVMACGSIADSICRTECESERNGVYHPETNGCVVPKNQPQVYLNQMDCEYYASDEWSWNGSSCVRSTESFFFTPNQTIVPQDLDRLEDELVDLGIDPDSYTIISSISLSYNEIAQVNNMPPDEFFQRINQIESQLEETCGYTLISLASSNPSTNSEFYCVNTN